MDKSKRDIYFHNLLEIKWHMQTGGNAILSGQQKQHNVPTGRVIKVVAARLSWTMPCSFFKVEFTSPILARTMRFSPHTED